MSTRLKIPTRTCGLFILMSLLFALTACNNSPKPEIYESKALGFTLAFPESFSGRYIVSKQEQRTNVYLKEALENNKGLTDYGTILFSIDAVSVLQSSEVLSSYSAHNFLGGNKEYYYFFVPQGILPELVEDINIYADMTSDINLLVRDIFSITAGNLYESSLPEFLSEESISTPPEPSKDNDSTEVSYLTDGISLFVDGKETLLPEEKFLCRAKDSYGNEILYFKAAALSELLGIKLVQGFENKAGSEKEIAPANCAATFFRGYQTLLFTNDNFAHTSKIGSNESVLSFAGYAAKEINREYYLSSNAASLLFFSRIILEEKEQEKITIEIHTLDYEMELIKERAASNALVFQKSGDAYTDRLSLIYCPVVQKNGSDCIMFGADDARIVCGPILGKLTLTEFGYIRTYRGKDQNDYLGLYVQPFGYESVPPTLSSIECIDYKTRLFSISKGFGENKRYGGMHIPFGLDQPTLLPCTRKQPMTENEIKDEIQKLGIPLKGSLGELYYTKIFETEDFKTSRETKGAVSLQFSKPLDWNYKDGECRNSLNTLTATFLPPVKLPENISLPIDFYKLFCSESAPMETIKSGHEPVYVVTCKQKSEVYEKSYILRRDDLLVCVKFYTPLLKDSYESALFLRIAQSISLADRN